MAQYHTDFSGDTINSQPSGWTARWRTDTTTWAVVAGATSPEMGGDRGLRLTGSTNARRLLSMDAVDADSDRADVDIVVRFRGATMTSDRGIVAVRASGAAGSETGYIIDRTLSLFRLRRISGGSISTLGSVSWNWNTNQWYLARLRAEGTAIRAKFWSRHEQEPAAWAIDVTNSDVTAAGWVGVITSLGISVSQDWDEVWIATDGDEPEYADGDPLITQAVLLYAFPEAPPARITQAVLLSLTREEPPAWITQAVLLMACHAVPCLTFWAQCWRIARADGTVMGFTSHDRPLPFQGTVYQPCHSLSASASELAAVLGNVGNLELAGIIADEAISEADLFGGLYDGARVEVWIVPWSALGGEVPYRLAAGRTGKVSQGDRGFTMEVLTPGAQIQQQALLGVYTPSCRWDLGDARCTVDLGPMTETGVVTGIAPVSAAAGAHRRIFADSGRGEADGWFELGVLTWLTGANAGATSEVKSFAGATGTFVLWQQMAHPIAIGDTYEVYPGCDKSPDTCKTKFSNFVNFGGFPDVPGKDAMMRSPDAKG